VKIKMLSDEVIHASEIKIRFKVKNLIIKPEENLQIEFTIPRIEPVEIIEYDPIKNY
jgi:hypothetical protein